jgi:hypothetical protein
MDMLERYLSGSAEMRSVMTDFDSGHFHIMIIHDGNDLREENSVAARMLRELRADVDRIREELLTHLHQPPPKRSGCVVK